MVVLIRRGSVYNRDVFLFLTSRLASIWGLASEEDRGEGGGGGGGGWELIRDYIVVTVTKLKDAEKCLLTASRLPPSSCLDPVPVKKTRTY